MSADFLHRYCDDREDLSSEELDALVAALRADPERAQALREQLMLDDLLAQKLTLDRRNFPAQVEQRIADYERGQEELDRQVHTLRELAEAELHRPTAWTASSPWGRYLLALSAAVAICVALLISQWTPATAQALATVVEVSGDVRLVVGKDESTPAPGAPILGDHRVFTPAGASLAVEYVDRTRIWIGGASDVAFHTEKGTSAKRVTLQRGELVAAVTPQAGGPMQFSTPHAVATVRGTRLRLTVNDADTLLDVTEGRVQLDELASRRSIAVAAHQTAVASRQALELRSLAWPENRAGLVYLFSPLETTPEDGRPLMAARNPATGNLRKTDLASRGAAKLLARSLELSGGYFVSDEAGTDIQPAFADQSELTLELVFRPALVEQRGQACLFALTGDSEPANLRLTHDGGRLTFAMLTGSADEPALLRVPVANVAEALHLTLCYSRGELVAFQGGAVIAREHGADDLLAAWKAGPLTIGADSRGQHAWQGEVQALALYNRCLTPAEVTRNDRSFRLLAWQGR